MIRADHEPHEVRHDDADERDAGPASDTAAPVASDALTSADALGPRHVHAARRGRVRPTLIRSSDARQRREAGRGERASARARPAIGVKPPTSSDPISHRTVRNVSGEVGEVLDERDERAEERRPASTPASSSTIVDVPRRRAAERP